MTGLTCGICQQAIKPGDHCDFVGLAPSERGQRRVVIVDDPDRLAVVHWACAHPAEPMSSSGNCERCGASLHALWTMSYFNSQHICLECSRKERAHPRFEEARQAELEAVQRGDLNFPGIGLPADLL